MSRWARIGFGAIIPVALLIYGRASGKRWPLYVGGVWLAFVLVFNFAFGDELDGISA